MKEEEEARKGVIEALDKERDERSVTKGKESTREIMKAYRYRSRTQTPEKAQRGLVSDTLGEMSHRTTYGGKREVAQGTLKWLAEQKRQNPKLVKVYDDLVARVKRRFKRLGEDIVIVNGRIYRNSASAWRKISDTISSRAERAKQKASTSFTELQKAAVRALKQMGFSEKDAKLIIQAKEKGGQPARSANAVVRGDATVENRIDVGTAAGPSAPAGTNVPRNALGGRLRRARGGRIRGRGLGDTVPLVDGSMAAPGELIVNRHTESEHDADAAAYGLPTLAQRINLQRRPHSAPRRYRRSDAYRATGGRVNLMGANQGLAPYAQLGASYGLSVTSGNRPGSITNSGNVSNHASGNALDISGPAPSMLSFARAMAEQYGSGLDELIHTPLGWGIKNGQRVPPYAAADHYDHVHVGDKSPGGISNPVLGSASSGGMGTTAVEVTTQMTGFNGVPGALAKRAIEAYAAGLNQNMSAIPVANGGASPSGTVPGNLDGWLTEALNITGQYSPQNLAGLRSRAMQESNGDPRAQNNWDSNAKKGTPSKGLLQTIEPTFNANSLPGMTDIWNPVHNAVAAIRYMLNRYGHIVAANGQGYEEGGRLGSEFIRSAFGGKPSLFASKSKGGEVSVKVTINNVNVASAGEAGVVGEAIGNQVAAKLASALRASAVM